MTRFSFAVSILIVLVHFAAGAESYGKPKLRKQPVKSYADATIIGVVYRARPYYQGCPYPMIRGFPCLISIVYSLPVRRAKLAKEHAIAKKNL